MPEDDSVWFIGLTSGKLERNAQIFSDISCFVTRFARWAPWNWVDSWTVRFTVQEVKLDSFFRAVPHISLQFVSKEIGLVNSVWVWCKYARETIWKFTFITTSCIEIDLFHICNVAEILKAICHCVSPFKFGYSTFTKYSQPTNTPTCVRQRAKFICMWTNESNQMSMIHPCLHLSQAFAVYGGKE